MLEPGAKYVYGWHIGAICEHLEAVYNGQILRLQINEPPGCMKSLVASVMYPAWEWGPGKKAWLRYLTTSYKASYAERDSRKHRDLVSSEWYQTLWPHVKLLRDNASDFENTERGSRRASSFESLTSGRGNRVIMDDPHSVEDVESPTEREKAVFRFREVSASRINDPRKDAIVVIMHRLHTEDVCAIIEELHLDFVKLVLPMQYEPKTVIYSPYFKDPRTREGELLFPEFFTPEALQRIKAQLTGHAWACQYQQTPSSREGGMFKRHWFKIVDALPSNIVKRVRRWDLAASLPKPGGDPDWTAGVKMATDNKNYYIEDVVRFRELGFRVRSHIKTMAISDTRKCHIVVPQDPGQAGKAQAASIIAENAGYIIKAERETGDKATRAEPLAAQTEAGNVYLLRGPWNEAFIDELCSFPQGHDDQFDAGAGAFNYLAGKKLPHIPDSVLRSIQATGNLSHRMS